MQSTRSYVEHDVRVVGSISRVVVEEEAVASFESNGLP